MGVVHGARPSLACGATGSMEHVILLIAFSVTLRQWRPVSDHAGWPALARWRAGQRAGVWRVCVLCAALRVPGRVAVPLRAASHGPVPQGQGQPSRNRWAVAYKVLYVDGHLAAPHMQLCGVAWNTHPF